MPEEVTPQFAADAVATGAVSKDGAYVAIEFVAGLDRLWVTLPVSSLDTLRTLCSELETLRHDAKNGVANRWHVTVTGKGARLACLTRDRRSSTQLPCGGSIPTRTWPGSIS